MEFKEPSQNDLEQINKKEAILSNPAFKRFAGGFELYKELVNRKDVSTDRDLIFKRMHELYKLRADNKDGQPDETRKNIKATLIELIFPALKECEEEKFDLNSFAEKISTPPLYDLFSAEWNHVSGDVEQPAGMSYLNETYAYKIGDNDTISVHLRPSNIESKDTNQTIAMQYNNKSLKKYLETGEKPEVRQIVMTSQEFIQKFGRV